MLHIKHLITKQEKFQMKKHDLKKLALLGVTAGYMAISQVATADEPRNEESSQNLLATAEEEEDTSGALLAYNACGAGCGGKGRPEAAQTQKREGLIAEEDEQIYRGQGCGGEKGYYNTYPHTPQGHGCASANYPRT